MYLFTYHKTGHGISYFDSNVETAVVQSALLTLETNVSVYIAENWPWYILFWL